MMNEYELMFQGVIEDEYNNILVNLEEEKACFAESNTPEEINEHANNIATLTIYLDKLENILDSITEGTFDYMK